MMEDDDDDFYDPADAVPVNQAHDAQNQSNEKFQEANEGEEEEIEVEEDEVCSQHAVQSLPSTNILFRMTSISSQTLLQMRRPRKCKLSIPPPPGLNSIRSNVKTDHILVTPVYEQRPKDRHQQIYRLYRSQSHLQ